jgi:hypothetical protein
LNQRLSRACIVDLVIKRTNWSYVKTMSYSGSHLGITINIKNTKFVKDLPMIDAQFRFVHWMVLYKLYVFCSHMKFKMAATAGLSLILDPMGKMFQNASSLKPLGQLKPNCSGMIIGRSSVFYADRKSKMAATTGHSINTGTYGENTEIYSSLKLLQFFIVETN